MGLSKKIISSIPTHKDITSVLNVPLKIGKNLGVVIHTCDKYEFCWNGWWYYFRKHWDFDLPCNCYFMNEEKPVSFEGFGQVATGSGQWSDRLIKGLNSIPEENILYLQEDFWLTGMLPVQRIYNAFCHLKMNAVRCCSTSRHYKVHTYFNIQDLKCAKFSRLSNYLVSHQASIWNKCFFLSCLKKNETPWQNELDGTLRLRKKLGLLKIYHINVDWYVSTCRQGQLTDEGIKMEKMLKDNTND